MPKVYVIIDVSEMLKINEIFFSVQGESSWAGWPTVFIRTSGCNLRCTYCDTTYAYYEGEKLATESLLETVQKYGAKYVCLTGGEPLLQKESLDLMKRLCDSGYNVSLETSGSIACQGVDSRVKKILDVKTPDSGEPDSFLLENIELATPLDEFKFVICSEKDFDWAEEFVEKHDLCKHHLVLFSPSFGQVKESWLAEKVIASKFPVRLQLQQHKYIWPPNTRGV